MKYGSKYWYSIDEVIKKLYIRNEGYEIGYEEL